MRYNTTNDNEDKGLYKSCVSDSRVEPPLMKPPASYRGLNTPGGVQIYSHTATGYKILGSNYNTAADVEPADVPMFP